MEQIPVIRIGNGSTSFYVNIIRSYLKNHEKVNVVAGGYRINIAVWVCFLIQQEQIVTKINSHFLDNAKIQTIFSFQVSREEPPCASQGVYNILLEHLPLIKINKSSPIQHYRKLASENHANVIIAAGSTCAKAFFLMSHLYKDGFVLKSLNITKTYIKDKYKAGVRIEVYKNLVLSKDDKKQ